MAEDEYGLEINEDEELEIKEENEDPSDKLTPDHPRFKKVYGKMKDLERTLEEKNDEFTKNQELMRQHNQALEGKINEMLEQKSTVSAVSGGDDDVSDIMKQIDEASAEEDFAKVVKLQSKLFTAEMAKIKPVDTKTIVDEVRKSLDGSKDDAEFEKWMGDNEWYDKNAQAKLYADALGKKLQGEGVSYKQLLKKVADETKDVFGIKEDEDNDNISSVSTSSYGSKGGKSKKVTWSKEDENMRQMFNISKEDFAKQKMFSAGGN